jgi:hypothetical protein
VDSNGKYDREDLVRIAAAAFGPCIEVDHEKGKGYYVDLLRKHSPDDPLRMKRVCTLCSEKTGDKLAKKILGIAGVTHESWTEQVAGKAVLKWETMDSLTEKLRNARTLVAGKVAEQLSKEGIKEVARAE